MIVLKILTFLWPFIREMMFGDKKLSEILKRNKRRLALTLLLLVSLGVNLVVVPKLFTITKTYLELVKSSENEKCTQNTSPRVFSEIKNPIVPTTPFQTVPVKKELLNTENTVKYPKKGKTDSTDKNKGVPLDHTANPLKTADKEFEDILQKEKKALEDKTWAID
ncbi:MAG: hypothetical protein ACD_84C00021G0003 [uncultured bacterium]|nr:MAG: hypothetical protein ACD_84C00021G0003 [uncultured bacterium]